MKYSGTGDYKFNITYTNANESVSETKERTNNSIKTAKCISFDRTYIGQIATNDSTDIYTNMGNIKKSAYKINGEKVSYKNSKTN